MSDKKNWLAREFLALENDLEFQIEELKLNVTEEILRIMEENSVSRKQLAELLGCSPAYISKLLAGTQNLTLENLFKIAATLHHEIRLEFFPARKKPETTVKKKTGKSSSSAHLPIRP